MKNFYCVLALFCALAFARAQPTNPIPLWPSGAPGALGTADKDIPTLTGFFPEADKATGAAVVICPGGGYGGLAPHEGAGYAEWLADHGIAGIVFKYRVRSERHPQPPQLQHAQLGLRPATVQSAPAENEPQRVR